MEYTEIKLNVSNDKIKKYKLFDGIKIYSDIFISEDKKSLTNKRVYITKKKNYVYYERTDAMISVLIRTVSNLILYLKYQKT